MEFIKKVFEKRKLILPNQEIAVWYTNINALKLFMRIQGFRQIQTYEEKKAIIISLNEGTWPKGYRVLKIGYPCDYFADKFYQYVIEPVPENINELPAMLDLHRYHYFMDHSTAAHLKGTPGISYIPAGEDLSGLDIYYKPDEF